MIPVAEILAALLVVAVIGEMLVSGSLSVARLGLRWRDARWLRDR